jgi:hypothetical protein
MKSLGMTIERGQVDSALVAKSDRESMLEMCAWKFVNTRYDLYNYDGRILTAHHDGVLVFLAKFDKSVPCRIQLFLDKI